MWPKGVVARDEAGKRARSQSVWDLHILLEGIVCKNEIQGVEMFKRADIGVGVVLAIGLEERDLSQGRRSQELYQSHISWIHCPPDFKSKTLLCWDLLLYMAHTPRAEHSCQALSTLMDFKVCAPHCLSASWDDSNQSPCLHLLIELQRKGSGAFSKPWSISTLP